MVTGMNTTEIIRRAIEIGKASREITFDQVNELCPAGMAPEVVEQLFEAGINVAEACRRGQCA
jgi:hypothetical protein